MNCICFRLSYRKKSRGLIEIEDLRIIDFLVLSVTLSAKYRRTVLDLMVLQMDIKDTIDHLPVLKRPVK